MKRNKKNKKRKNKKKKKLKRPNPDFRIHQSPRGPGASPFFFFLPYGKKFLYWRSDGRTDELLWGPKSHFPKNLSKFSHYVFLNVFVPKRFKGAFCENLDIKLNLIFQNISNNFIFFSGTSIKIINDQN